MAQAKSVEEAAAEAEVDLRVAELQAQVAALKSDLGELTSAVTRYSRAQAESLKAQAAEGIRYAQDVGQEQLAAASEYAGRKYAETEDYIRTNPTTAVGIAAGIGFLFGLIMARR